MKLTVPILLIMLVAIVWSCEKQSDDYYLNTSQYKVDSSNISVNTQANYIDRPYYYKDSLREASLLRAKNVLTKHEGYELMSTEITKIDKPKVLEDKDIYIERIRNKKDMLCIKVIWKSNIDAKMICGLEYKDSDKMNLLCRTFDEKKSESPVYYEIRYIINKRKWTRLKFQFEGEDIKVMMPEV